MDKRLVDNITISISTILIILGAESYAKEFFVKYAFPMLIVGVVVLIFGPMIIKDFHNKTLKKILASSVGIFLLILGSDYWLESQVRNFGWVYILAGLIIYNYAGKTRKPNG